MSGSHVGRVAASHFGVIIGAVGGDVGLRPFSLGLCGGPVTSTALWVGSTTGRSDHAVRRTSVRYGVPPQCIFLMRKKDER